MKSYLQGQDLWEVVAGTETTSPLLDDDNGNLKKQRIKVGKAMFTIKITIEEEMMENIRDVTTPKEAWDSLTLRFSKKNDIRIQLLKNELMFIS